MWHRDSWIISVVSLCLFVTSLAAQAAPLEQSEERPPPAGNSLTVKGILFTARLLAAEEFHAEEYILTAYDHGPCCCGKWAYYKGGGWTASGTKVKAGRTIAVDPRVIPLGTIVYIEGLGLRVAEDTGSAIKGRRIDVYVTTHSEAVKFGVQQRRVIQIRRGF